MAIDHGKIDLGETPETPALLTRMERAREYLYQPKVIAALNIIGCSGMLGTVFLSTKITEHFTQAGDPNTVLKTVVITALGVFGSNRLLGIQQRRQLAILESSEYPPVRDMVKKIKRNELILPVVGTALIGWLTSISADNTYQTEKARIANLPNVSSQTAIDQFCDAANQGRTIAVKTNGSNGKPMEFQLSCPVVQP